MDKNIIMKLSKLYNNCGRKNKITRDLWLEGTLIQIPKDSKILDVGSGELRYKKYCKHLEYVSQDFGQYNGKGDDKGLQTGKWDNTKIDIVSDITNIPVPSSSFDAIMCIEVFEHIPDPINAIKEFSRILKRGGTLILTAPVCSLTHFAPYYFYNGYSKYFYEKFLYENGFKIQELSNNGNWFEYIAQELHRLPNILNRYANFSGGRLFLVFLRIVLVPLFILLAKASNRDKGSSEVLSHGIHIKAVKV